ncbi:MAG: prephenate dehydratase, partial [Bacteroidetes bacterium]|nr:prephenate dehydratase [Bacteroidota bacterium]
KIQSMPVTNTPWKYSFFVDITFEDYTHYEKALQVMAIMTESFKVLGTYINKLN